MIKNYFNFSEFLDGFLLTNDLGKHIYLSKQQFNIFLKDELQTNLGLKELLIQGEFVTELPKELFIKEVSEKMRKSKSYLFESTQLHIFVLTTRCNMSCKYCQASADVSNKSNQDMSIEVAKECVDIAFQSKSNFLTIEFQGGEPLLNFDTLKYIVEYAKEKSIETGKKVEFNVVSNFLNMEKEVVEFLLVENVNMSTSIDGNIEVHDTNRPMINGCGTFNKIIENLQIVREMCIKNGVQDNISAIMTTTKTSLSNVEKIIDEYINLGYKSIFIRPLTPLGVSKTNWDTIGYDVKEFLAFYQKSLDYIIELNRNGLKFKEHHASLFLKKIMKNIGVNYMELRSPCGGGIGQVAYDYNGEIYTCDEARMLAKMGDKSFKIGDSCDSCLNDLLNNPVTETVSISSCLEVLPECSECVFMPYCGTCPVYNYVEQKSVFAKMPISYRCKINKGILGILFEYIYTKDDFVINMFEEWVS